MQDKVEEAMLSRDGLNEPGVVVGAGTPSGLVVQPGLKQQMLSVGFARYTFRWRCDGGFASISCLPCGRWTLGLRGLRGLVT